ncbi:hypothetical protein KC342_g8082 [Hortaea werneckii]|nr:hypothetical protein KC342_g8082 [Hortaea werneckii]
MSWKTVAEQQQSDLQQLQSRIDGLNRTVVERENTIHDLRFRLASTEEKLTSLENSITNTDTVPPAAAFQNFQRRLQAVEVEKAQLPQNADRATAQLEYSLAEFRQYQQQAEHQISHLRSKLAEYEQSRTNPPAVSGHVAVSTITSGNRNGPQRRPLAPSRITSARREDNVCPPFLRNDDEDDVEPDLAYMQKTVPGEPLSGPSQPSLPATPAAAAGQQARIHIDGQAPQTGPSTTPAGPGVSHSSTNPPRVRGGQTKTIETLSSTPPPRPTKQRPRRPKRNYSTFQDDDDDEYRPDTTSPERATPPSSNPTPSKTRRLRKSTTAATAVTSKNPLPTTTTTASSLEEGEEVEEETSSPSHSFPLPFKAVTTYTPPTSSPRTVDPQTGEWTVAEHFASEEISSELGELWDRLAIVREKWEVFKGPGWPSALAAAGGSGDGDWWEQTMAWLERKSFTPPPRGRGASGKGDGDGGEGRVFKPFCLTKMAMGGGQTRWRAGAEGRFACADCVASELPCLSWSPRYEAVLLLPLHELDRTRGVEEGLEIRYWLNL